MSFARSRTETAAGLNASVNQYIETLCKETDAARMSQAFLDYLDCMSSFYRYSPHNQLLILFANPSATLCAGFQAWHKVGRYVKKGEHGIPILAPMIVKDKEEEGKEHLLFRVVFVFDVSQTDGQPLPEPPEWKSPEKQAELYSSLVAYAQSLNISIETKDLAGETQGYSAGGKIVLSSDAGTETLIHEIAHEILHQVKGNKTPRQQEEIEAEAVGYVVARHFGLSSNGSKNYIAFSQGTSKEILASLDRITRTAKQIIIACEKETLIPEGE